MITKDCLHLLKNRLEELKKSGIEKVDTGFLIDQLDEVISHSETIPPDITGEIYKANLQNNASHRLERLRITANAGQNALRTAFFMNGGATIALLTFIGNLSTNNPSKIPLLASSLFIFVSGVSLIALASGATYLSELFYRTRPKFGSTFNRLSITLSVLSYGAFIWGTIKAYLVFSSFA